MAKKKEGGVDITNFMGVKGILFSRKGGAVIIGLVGLVVAGAPIAEIWTYIQTSVPILIALIAGEDVAGKLKIGGKS